MAKSVRAIVNSAMHSNRAAMLTPLPEKSAVGLFDRVAEMNVDAEFDAVLERQAPRCAPPRRAAIQLAQRTASTTLRKSSITPSPAPVMRE